MAKYSHCILAVVISIASAAAGYVYGASLREKQTSHERPTNTEGQDKDGESDDEDASADGDLSAVTAGFLQPCKLTEVGFGAFLCLLFKVLVVRTDLNMTSGKIAAQCGHATLACYKALVKRNPRLVRHWETTGQAKIALKVSSEEEILELEAIAKSLNLCARSVQDAGRTQVEAGSRTVLGIGPAPVELVNQVTGHLRLL